MLLYVGHLRVAKQFKFVKKKFKHLCCPLVVGCSTENIKVSLIICPKMASGLLLYLNHTDVSSPVYIVFHLMLIPDIQYQELNFCLDIKLCLKLYTIVVQNVKNETKKKGKLLM